MRKDVLHANRDTIQTIVRYASIVTALASLATMISIYHEAVITHQNRAAQFAALRDSPVCRDHAQRIASRHVNNCDAADVAARSFEPYTAAALDTLQALSVCGVKHSACREIIAAISDAGFKFTLLLVLFIVAMVWLILHKREVDSMVSTKLPLDTPNYPAHTPYYCIKSD